MLKGLSDEGNSLVIIRENVQSNLRERGLREVGDIFGDEEGPVTLLLNYLHSYPPGS